MREIWRSGGYIHVVKKTTIQIKRIIERSRVVLGCNLGGWNLQAGNVWRNIRMYVC